MLATCVTVPQMAWSLVKGTDINSLKARVAII